MKQQQLIFVSIWLIVALWVLLEEFSLLPQGFIGLSAEGEYLCNLLCFLTAVGGTYLACRLFAFKRVKKELFPTEGTPDLEAHRRWNNRRLAIVAAAILPSTFLYYAATYSQTALYCALLALAGSLLCWPQMPLADKEEPAAKENETVAEENPSEKA